MYLNPASVVGSGPIKDSNNNMVLTKNSDDITQLAVYINYKAGTYQ